jgi:hypothetical protein
MIILLFIAGIASHTMMFFAPVHEVGHWLVASLLGYHANIVAWTVTEVSPIPRGGERFLIYWAGPAFETIVWWIVARKAKNKYLKALAWGVWFSCAVFVVTYTDVTKLDGRGSVAWYVSWGIVFLIAMWNNRVRSASDARRSRRDFPQHKRSVRRP